MGNRRALRILHFSDLHLGKERTSLWRMRRVLGDAWKANLREVAADGPIDLVCFTGDMAQSGKRDQYDEATRFVDEALALLRVPKDRFFCVPGNHDIDRSVSPDAWSQLREGAGELAPDAFSRWIAGGRTPRGFEDAWPDAIIERQAEYRQWLMAIGRSALLPAGSPHGRLGYRVSLDLGLGAPLHVVGLDSAWLAGDEHDAGKLQVTDEQVGRLLTDQGERLPGWAIALVHHPLTDIADGRSAQRLLSEYGVSLLLHGHLHDPELARWNTPAASQHVSAAGCLYEHDRFPNCMQVLDVHLTPDGPIEPRQLWARSWSGRGHWHNDDSLYPDSSAGRLALMPRAALEPPLIPGSFIGRQVELEQLCNALLPLPGRITQPTVLCCAIEGMGGVGKTRLAEHFVQQCWLPALGLPTGEETNPCFLRLVLDPLEPEAPTALGLGQHLADRLRCAGPADSLWPRLRNALQQGPHGHPRLLLIENIDADSQARAVGELVNHLQGCPILVTARYRRVGGQGWTRVPVAPMSADDARKLLLAETEPDGHPLSEAEADQLARQLGHLPLALHIAASHLTLGLTPAAFLDELHAAGLELAPAEPGDPRLSADRARSIIRSSFDISWRHWCAGRGNDRAWQQALVALAHGPASSTGQSLSAAIADLEVNAYPVFATAAARLSLLQYTPNDQQTVVHPLIAEFLRMQPVIDAGVVVARMSNWFMSRLRSQDDEAQGQAWREAGEESEALTHWLALLPPQDGLAAERAGRHFALAQGPYSAWRSLCERLIPVTAEAEDLSNLWWTLGRMAEQCGDPDGALAAARAQFDIDSKRGAERDAALAQGRVADVLQARGDLDEALRIRRDEELPVYEKLGDVRSRAVTMGKIAEVLQARGDLDEALRTWREELLPAFEKLGDVRSRAVTMGKIADVLLARGDLDEALRIRRNEELRVYEKVGEVRSRAMTMGKIADVLLARGDLDEALRIWRDEQLPVYEKLGDVRSRAVTMGKIADVLQARGNLDEALRIRRDEELPIYEKLGDMRFLLVGRANLALNLVSRGRADDRPEVSRLLVQAFAAARGMGLPEASKVADIYRRVFDMELSELDDTGRRPDDRSAQDP